MKFTQRPKQASGAERYLKLKDGESVTGVFRGEIYTYYSKWVSGEGVACFSDDPEAKARHKVNVIVPVNGQPMAKVFEFSDPVYEQLSALNEEYPLESVKVKITRKGMDKSTRYFFMPAKEPLNVKAIEHIELQILNGKGEGSSSSAPLPPPFNDGPEDYGDAPDFEDIPF